jgi:hypothetical protein
LRSINNSYHADVFLGWIGWAAGSFSTSYELSLVPTNNGGNWVDTGILSSCVAGKFKQKKEEKLKPWPGKELYMQNWEDVHFKIAEH